MKPRYILGLVAASLVVVVCAARPGAEAQPGRSAVQPRFAVHEWGVWRIQRGQIEHLDDLARESPPFVMRYDSATGTVRQNGPQQPQPVPVPLPVVPRPPQPPRPHPVPIHPHVARKPVVFFHADQPTDVEMEIEFPHGEPFLFHPNATLANAPPAGFTLTWRGRVVPGGTAAQPPAVATGHFFEDLRNAGGDLFLASDGTAERFVFYDGRVPFEPPFVVARQPGGAAITRRSTEANIWLVDGGTFLEHEIGEYHAAFHTRAAGDMNLLHTRLHDALVARGLDAAEATSLLETWRDDLFGVGQARAIYFLPRASYDRMLPITITPTPTELIRVGLVIEIL